MTVIMPLLPAWKKIKAVAHTVPYDMTFCEEYLKGRPLPAGRWAGVATPVLVIVGGKSPEWMRNGTEELAGLLPDAQRRVLPGQTHMVKPKVTAPVLAGYFGA